MYMYFVCLSDWFPLVVVVVVVMVVVCVGGALCVLCVCSCCVYFVCVGGAHSCASVVRVLEGELICFHHPHTCCSLDVVVGSDLVSGDLRSESEMRPSCGLWLRLVCYCLCM
jgi:hypothetical protein